MGLLPIMYQEKNQQLVAPLRGVSQTIPTFMWFRLLVHLIKVELTGKMKRRQLLL